MIISQTPLRVSLFGGGTDIKEYYEKYEGAVISTTINKYVYVIVKQNYMDDDIVINYLENERAENVNEIKHGIIRETLKLLEIDGGIEIISLTDVPLQGTGLGSSSAFTVGLLKALLTFQGKKIDNYELAELASHIEIDLLGEPIGKQDQYAAAFGGLNEYVFCKDGRVHVNKIELDNLSHKAVSSHMQLFYTGCERKASAILSDQKNKMQQNAEHLHELKDIAQKSKQHLIGGHIHKIGELLNLSWEKKKKLSAKIQNIPIENLYNLGMEGKALGGKLLGAGGGGYFLFLCSPENHDELRKKLIGFNELPISLESSGCRVLSSSALKSIFERSSCA